MPVSGRILTELLIAVSCSSGPEVRRRVHDHDHSVQTLTPTQPHRPVAINCVNSSPKARTIKAALCQSYNQIGLQTCKPHAHRVRSCTLHSLASAAPCVAARLVNHYLQQLIESSGDSFGLSACPLHRGVACSITAGQGRRSATGHPACSTRGSPAPR